MALAAMNCVVGFILVRQPLRVPNRVTHHVRAEDVLAEEALHDELLRVLRVALQRAPEPALADRRALIHVVVVTFLNELYALH